VHLLLACDKFRGSLTAAEANAAILDALDASALRADADCVPLADGGEGTLDALDAGTAERRRAAVTGPFGAPVTVEWLLDPARRRAVVEMAAAAGHGAVGPAGYDPDTASSVGVGELVCAALDGGATEIVVALGGSVTVDGGAGALEALGARFLDADRAPLLRPAGRALGRIAGVDLSGLDRRLSGVTIILACDVDNPLAGPRGAARVFGPQKGVAAEAVDAFDAALVHLDAILAEARGGEPLAEVPHAGAAGGMMVGLSAAARTLARDGFALVAEHHALNERVAAVDLVVTGEGSLDPQSLGGKGPVAIARMAREAAVPAIAFAGRLAAPSHDLRAAGITAAFAIARGPSSLEEALAGARPALVETARNVFDLFAAARASGRR
jgi:glycerate kinase